MRKIYGQEEPLGLRMIIDGSTIMLPNVFDPSELRSDVTGKVVRFLYEDGAEVPANTPYVECEAMKMIMQLRTTEAGKISNVLQPGSIIGAGDLLSTMELKDPSKVKQIDVFEGSVGSCETEDLSDLDKCNLIMDGYDMGDIEPIVSKLLFDMTAEQCTSTIDDLLNRYLSIEDHFKDKPLDAAVLALISANKGNEANVIDIVQAHLGIKKRNGLVLALMRNLASFPDRFAGFKVPVTTQELLEKISSLSGKTYGEVSLVAGQIATEFKIPDYQARLDDLIAYVTTDTPDAISKSRKLSLSVDLLSELFSHKDHKVRDAALEVYIRRVYRSHVIEDVKIVDDNGNTNVFWNFKLRDAPPQSEAPVKRYGMLSVVDDLSTFESKAGTVLGAYKNHMDLEGCLTEDGCINTFHVALRSGSVTTGEESKTVAKIETILKDNKDDLKCLGVRMVNALIPQPPKLPRYFSFLECNGYEEDSLRRDMRPSFPYLLELTRLSTNYDLTRIPALGRNAQLWIGTEKADDNVVVTRPRPMTVFLRAISHSVDTETQDGAERLLLAAMDELERAMLHPLITGAEKPATPYPVQYGGASSRIFLHVLNEYEADTQSVVKNFKGILDRVLAAHSTRLLKLRVDEIEVKSRISYTVDGAVYTQPIRLVASSSSGEWLKSAAYLEYPDPVTGVTRQYRALEEAQAGVMQISPYPTSNTVQMKRSSARRVGSTYAFDFLGLMEVGLIQQWGKHTDMQMPPSKELFEATELVLGEDGNLSPVSRPVGTNDIGMLAWHATMKTPEYPNGREIVLIANDVTVQSGSFGVKEDDFFFKASEYARQRGIPRLYISCNSGARIGLVEELKPKFKVAFNDESNPAAGFKFLYLTDEDYKALKPGTVGATKTTLPSGDTVWALDDIIGQIHGIGVENLRGSGLIAGETSRAYDETFTLSFVTGRSVGIGAYLVRLGKRVIQMIDGPMILTGYSALNKLLGKEVYTSQDQLGGPQVMVPNGITHEVVPNDQEGVNSMLDWLSYVPKDMKSQPPQVASADPVDRDIGFIPTKTPYDPRHMLAGHEDESGKFVSGFFDKGTFKEYLAGWGKSVVVGRAKLGGIPMGVIAVETRLSNRIIPADPANPDSRESIEPQAGQVWFPDSAYKTATAIEDFNRGENLPLIIFANWRGFSGGTRDMYSEVLKFGAMIVDGLRTYKHPVFIYLPPNGELRGGAWVVVDPTINDKMMEMYADKESRGGILEPPGICEVKFRKVDQIKTMHRLDDKLIALDKQLASTDNKDETASIKAEISKRENMLLPLYLQIAHEFADLHDRSGRMKAKGVITDVLSWKRSREYFYHRVQRKLAENAMRKSLMDADAKLSWDAATAKMKDMVDGDWEDDKAVTKWIAASDSKMADIISGMKFDSIANDISSKLDTLSADQRADLLNRLR